MGYQTVVVILNDGLHQIENNKLEFVDNLLNSIKLYSTDDNVIQRLNNTIPCGNHCNVAEVVYQEHADNQKLLLVGGNTAIPIEGNSWFTNGKKPLEYAAEILKQNGYVVYKKKDD